MIHYWFKSLPLLAGMESQEPSSCVSEVSEARRKATRGICSSRIVSDLKSAPWAIFRQHPDNAIRGKIVPEPH